MKSLIAGLATLLCSSVSVAAIAQTSDATGPQREEIVVIGTTPLPGSDVDRDKIPGTVQVLSADDFAKNHAITILDTLAERVPGLQLSDSQGNTSFEDLHYRGFAASPLQGTPQGIAVYQNGIRLNEAFGDTVNWDMIPDVAISKMSISSNNPAFGLNAIGGAVNMEMKNGFTYQGLAVELQGGSYGHAQGSVEYGVKSGDLSLYVAAEAARDDGYRLFSGSDLERVYADGGYSGDISEFHLIAQAARSNEGVVGSTPVELIAQNYGAVYTSPQTTQNSMGSVALDGKVNLSDSLTVEANVYGRYFGQKHIDGNDSDFEQCSAKSSFPGKLCLEDDPFGTPAGGKTTAFRNQFVIMGRQGQTFAFDPGTPYGTIDRTATSSTTVGGALQATYDAPIFGHGNNFVVGASLDHSDIGFTSYSTLGYINPDLRIVLNGSLPGSGNVIHTLGNLGYAPVGLNATTDYYGIYLADTFDITDRLSLTAGVRVNIIDIKTADTTGGAPELNATNDFTHANPEAGLTYRIGGGVTAYGGYSQANRAPTPLELDCADPAKPCLLENSLVSDPPLKQVVANSYEAGLRGNNEIAFGGASYGRLEWNAGLYRTDSNNDIVSLASVIQGRGYYTNVPSTRRQGIELGAQYDWGPWQAFLNYSFVDATYRFNGVLASPNNPAADDDGNIMVHVGNRIPGIPRHQIKAGLDYTVTPAWSVGGDVEYYGSQYLVGDDSNQNAKLTPYVILNIRTAYQVTENIQLFAKVNNLTNRHYASFGTYFETDGVGQPITDNLTDARSLTVGQPISGFGGMRFTF